MARKKCRYLYEDGCMCWKVVECKQTCFCNEHNIHRYREEIPSCRTCHTRKRIGGPGVAIADECDVLNTIVSRGGICDLWTNKGGLSMGELLLNPPSLSTLKSGGENR